MSMIKEMDLFQGSSLTSGRTSLLAKYDDDLKEGPNLTSMNNKWTHYAWSKHVVK